MTDRKQQVKTFFSERATEWAANYSDLEPRGLSAQNLISRQRFALEMVAAAVPRGSRILDVGCGTGEMAAKLMELGYGAWGVDIAEPMICYARDRHGSDRFRVGDIEHIPFQDNTFDAVVCLGVIEYLPTDEPALREIWRVLKPGGTAVLSTPSAISPLHHMDRVLGGLMPTARSLYHLVKYRLRGRRSPVHQQSRRIANRRYYRRGWLRLLRSIGFDPNEWICHGWGWYQSDLGRVAQSLFRIARLCRRGLDRLLGPPSLSRAKNRFVHNRALNWVASEQIVRACAVKSAVIRILAMWGLPEVIEAL